MTISYPLLIIVSTTLSCMMAATAVGGLVAAAGFPLPPGRGRIGSVDGLRGYLALAVMAHHFVIWMQETRYGGDWDHPTSGLLNNFGAGGVALFFMITGLVFYPRILAGLRGTSWIATFVNRAFRIIPLVAVSVVAIAVVIMARTGAWPRAGDAGNALEWIVAWDQPSLLGYPDSGRLDAYVLWSLRIEWIFYLLLLPACALAMDVVRGRLPSWVVPAAFLAVSLAARQTHLVKNLPQYLPLFPIGMLGYEAQRHAGLKRSLQTPAAAVLACAALVFGLASAPTPYAVPQMGALGFFFAAVACGNDFAGILSTRGARVLGECSFGIYLLHGTVLSLLFVEGSSVVGALPADLDFVLLVPVAAVLALVAPLTFLAVERPMIRLGSRLARRASGAPARPPAPRADVAPASLARGARAAT